jgi:hypothetical protein
MAQMDVDVPASADDGYGFPTGSVFDNTGTTMFFGDDGDASHCFMRFAIDADLVGATVTAATLSGTVDATGAGDQTATIYADDADDPAAPTTWAEIDGVTPTTATVDWTVDSGGGTVTSPDISAIIQELIDSYGPLDTEHFVFVMDPDGHSDTDVMEIHTQDDADPMTLHITYDTGATTSGILNGGGSIAATVTKRENQVLRPASTITANSWDTAPATGQNLHDYAGDDDDATWIEDTTA